MFENVTFMQDTKLNIERLGLPELADKDFDGITFGSSAISLVQPDILRKFPNLKRISVFSWRDWNVLNNQEKLENCINITHLVLSLEDFTGVSSNTFADCRNLENLEIQSKSLTDLPDGLFRNQQNLQDFKLTGLNVKLRVNPFEGLRSLSKLRLELMDLSQIEGNFFHKLNIKRLEYVFGSRSNTFTIELLKSHETLEEVFLQRTDLRRFPDDFVPILRTFKLKAIDLVDNRITSVKPFVDLPNVERIDLWNNEIKELPANSFSGCPKLTYLRLGLNPISSLGGNEFNLLSELKNLVLSYTHLTSIAPNIFHPLKSLERLDMRSSFKGDELVIEKELLTHSKNLKYLFLNDNNIIAIHPESFDNLKRLNTLYLELNKCVDGLFYTSQNKTLDMARVKNKLQTCFENYPKHVSICSLVDVNSVYTCFIKNIQVKQNEEISISANHQAGKSDSDVSSVIFLDSKLHVIPPSIFSKFQNLKEVNVESTELEELNHLENCGTLETLRASFNNIAEIKDDAFKDCTNLRTVDLQSNKIEKLGKIVFKHNEKLREINLARNVIEKIEPCGFLSNHSELRSLNLLDNICVDKNVQVAYEELEKVLVNCYISWYLSVKLAENL